MLTRRAEPGATLWGRWEQPSGFGGPQGPGITASTGTPTEAVLAGTIVLEMKHVDRVLARHATTSVTLVRSAADTDDWRLAPGEAARIAAGDDGK